MKKTMMLVAIAGLLLLSPLTMVAQYTNPGNPGGNPQSNGDPPLGGGAPIGGGLFILLGLGAAYGGKKVYHLFDEEENKPETNENQMIN